MAVDFINADPSSGGKIAFAGGRKQATLAGLTGSSGTNIDESIVTQIGSDLGAVDFERIILGGVLGTSTQTIGSGSVVGQTLEIKGGTITSGSCVVTFTGAHAGEDVLTIDGNTDAGKYQWNGTQWFSMYNAESGEIA